MKYFQILLISLVFSVSVWAQKQAPENWFTLDAKADKAWGVSSEKAYQKLSIGKNKDKVIVAVIDAGTDIDHEDLKMNLWVNPKEVAGNGLDDDGNGYIDDVNGWSFIGGKLGNVNEDTYEFTRIVAKYAADSVTGEQPKFANDAEKALYNSALALYRKEYDETEGQLEQLNQIMGKVKEMAAKTGSKNPTLEQVEALPAESKEDKSSKMILKYIIKTGGMENSPIVTGLAEAQEQLGTMMKYNLNKKFNPRNLVGDDYENVSERNYGNNAVNAPNMDHGTHVAGIIAANRYNEEGIKGICGEAVIMTVRVVPNGDERDKDVANAIRYAADNGAKVINMSFGKKLSPNKDIVDEAVEYAMKKDVLLVHAAGNDGLDLATNNFYPSALLHQTGTKAPNWIEVGASGWEKGKGRVASFSNYGKNEVDIFAPGVDLNSTMPGSKYKSEDGTSMASPVVAGVAALIRQNYPNLSAVQTKQIILMSAVPCKEKVIIPGTKKKGKLKQLCATGGIVNAYEALVLAEKVSKGEVKLPQ